MCIKYLVIGKDSVIGSAICEFLRKNLIPYISTTRKKEHVCSGDVYLNLGKNILAFSSPIRDGVAIVCAGLTGLQECEADPERTSNINVHETVFLMKMLARSGNRIVFFSTSHVFDGKHAFPRPTDVVNANTEYGRQKCSAEKALLQIQPDALIVRLSKVLPSQDVRLQQWQLAWQKGIPTKVFADMWVAPIDIKSVVSTIFTLIARGCTGVWHISSSTEVTYAELAIMFATCLGYDGSLVEESSAALQIPAIFRPRHVALQSCDTWRACACPAPTCEGALCNYLKGQCLL